MDDLSKKITDRLEELRVHLQADGGDLEIVGIDGKTVQLRLRGACGGCPHAAMTIKGGLERIRHRARALGFGSGTLPALPSRRSAGFLRPPI